jgi:hypothetical protein
MQAQSLREQGAAGLRFNRGRAAWRATSRISLRSISARRPALMNQRAEQIAAAYRGGRE